MKNILQKIHTFFVKLPIVWFILIILISQFIIDYCLLFVLSYILIVDDPTAYDYFLQFPYWLQLTILFPAAFIETILYQWLVFKILRLIKFFRNNIIIIVLISALLFGVSHYNNLIQQIITFFGGIVLAYSYILTEEKKLSPVLVVTIIHFIYNVILFSIINIFE